MENFKFDRGGFFLPEFFEYVNRFVALALLLMLFLTGCASPQMTHYEPLEAALLNRDFQTPPELLKEAREAGNYSEKDRVLYWIEQGIALHYAGEYQESNELLTLADERIEELFTTRLSEVGYAFITNPNEMEYEGDPHEDIYINIFKALNYLKLGEPRSARVEARKLNNKLNYMHDRYQQRADQYRSAAQDRDFMESSEEELSEFEMEAVEFHTSALARYIGYMVYLHEGELDSVRIDWRNMRRAFSEQPHLYRNSFPSLPENPRVGADSVPVHFIVNLGFGPVKHPQNLYLPWRSGQHIKVALPEMVKRGTEIDRVEIYKEGEFFTGLETFEDINLIAENIFRLRFPAIMGTAFVRAIAKRVGATEVRDRAAGASPILGIATAVAGEVYIEQSEQPDLRLVRTLPGEFRVGMVMVPPGEYQFEIRYYSGSNLIMKEQFAREVTRDRLNFVVGRSFR